MARPRTQLDTHGSIALSPQAQDDTGRWHLAPAGTRPARWKARTKHRDPDGVLRDVTRFAPTKARAEALLKAALVERAAPAVASAVMRSESTVEAAGEHWLAQVDRGDSNLSPNTRRQYRDSFNRYVKGSSISNLTLVEANSVPVLEGWLQGVADARGTGAAKTARSVVSGILTLALRYRVLTFNAMRDVRPARSQTVREAERDTARALTRDERQHLIEVARQHGAARSQDVAGIVLFLAGTGVRIGEALAQRWADVDIDAGTVLVRGTKTAASTRLLTLPPWLHEEVRDRAATKGTDGLLFPSPGIDDKTKVRNRRNVARIFRSVLDEAGFPWATPHTLRRTVATLLDEAGRPLVEAANQLGHADPSMTARVYLGRKGSLADAAKVL